MHCFTKYGFLLMMAAVLILITAGSARSSGQSATLIRLQATTPGTQQVGNTNISGKSIAGQFQGNGASLTGLNASSISSGTLASTRLPATIARTDVPNNFGLFTNTFLGGVGIGTASPQSSLHIKGNAGLLNLEGTDHCYVQLYPDGFASGRKAYIGFPSGSSNDVIVANEFGGGYLRVAANGNVGINLSNPVTPLHVYRALSVSAESGVVSIMSVLRPGTTTPAASMFWDGSQSAVFADRKDFHEPNPDDPKTDIWYSCIEGPEAAMYARGTASLVGGHAKIELPFHFKSLASENGMTVQLTPLSVHSKGLAIVHKGLDGIEVGELADGTGSYDFDWEVKSVRKQFENFPVIHRWDELLLPGTDKKKAWEERMQRLSKSP